MSGIRLTALYGGGEDTIVPSSIGSGEAFGTAVLAGPITVTGIASAEAFGTTGVEGLAQFITLTTGVASAEAFGALALAHIIPTSIASEEAFGTPFLFLGNISLEGFGITSEEAFGSHTVSLGLAPLFPTGIAGAEAFGNAVLVLGGVGTNLILPLGIPRTEAFGTPTLSRGAAQAEGWDRLGSLDAGRPFGLLPPQDLEPFPNMQHMDFNSLTFRRWFEKLQIRVRQQNQIKSDQLQLDTVNLADFGSRLHQDLDNVEGTGPAGDAQHWTTQEKLDNVVWRWIAIDT